MTRSASCQPPEHRTKYEYDSLGQVKSGKKYWSDQTPVAGQQFEYAFDDIGNRTGAKAGGNADGAGLRSASYTVNYLNQYNHRTVPSAVDVMGVSFATNTVLVNNQTAYRKGEYFRKELAVNNTAGPVQTSVSVAASGQTTVSGTLLLAPAQEQFAYDADGNLLQDGLWTYTWDGENRLVALESTNGLPESARLKLEFRYDYQGRRIEKIVSSWDAQNWTWVPQYTNRFVYDGWNLVAMLHPDASVIRSFMWGLDLSGTLQGAGGVGGLLFIGDCSSSGYCSPAFDGNGNVMALVSTSGGTNCATYEYGPFGEVIRQTGPMAKANPFRFSTKYQDNETDLLYYGYRYYNASTGRWPNRDPIREAGFGPVGISQKNLSNMYKQQIRSQLMALMPKGPFAEPVNSAVDRLFLTGPGGNAGGEESNPYVFTRNDSIDHVDKLGLLTYTYRCPSYRFCATCWLKFDGITGKQLYYLAVNAPRFMICATKAHGIMNLGCALGSRWVFNEGCDGLAGCVELYTRQIWPPLPPGPPPL